MANVPPAAHRPNAVQTNEFGLGKAPVARQAAITSPAAEVAALKTAVDALITTLEAYGLVTPN